VIPKILHFCSDPIPSEGVYANHLWESRPWSNYYLRDLTPARVRLIDSNFHQWIRPLIADLPDNLGAPSFSGRAIQLLKERPRDWPGSRIRRVASALRERYTLIDRTLRNRHHFNLIDPVLRIIASVASKQLGSDSNLISYCIAAGLSSRFTANFLGENTAGLPSSRDLVQEIGMPNYVLKRWFRYWPNTAVRQGKNL
jgi:hypothetical protein